MPLDPCAIPTRSQQSKAKKDQEDDIFLIFFICSSAAEHSASLFFLSFLVSLSYPTVTRPRISARRFSPMPGTCSSSSTL